MTDPQGLPSRVARIVEAAERAAEEVRSEAEHRARERIAEADRACDLRVQAAEAEAREILEEAARTRKGVEQEAQRMRAEAEQRALETVATADEEAERLRAEAQREATSTRDDALADATSLREETRDELRATLANARAAAREVLGEGTELSDNLRALGDSLRTNAERLLRDVRTAHGTLSAQLGPDSPPEGDVAARHGARGRPAPAGRDDVPTGEFDVPDFIPRR